MLPHLQPRDIHPSSDVSIVEPAREAAWDEYVASHPNGWICLSSGWKRVLEESFPHIKGHFLSMTDERGAIRAGLGLYSVTSRLTGRRLVSVPFATLSDPLVSNEAQWKALTDSAISMSKELKTDYLEIRTHSSTVQFPADRFGVIDSYRHHSIPLDRDLDQIKKSFDRTCVRQRISRAEKSGVAVQPVRTEKDLREFYRLYLMSRKRIQRPPQPYRFIRSLWSHFGPDTVSVRLARYQHQYVAGIMLFRFRNRVSAEFLVIDERFLAVSPGHLLFWEAIREAWNRKDRSFDFGRTAATNTPLMDYKNRWGTTVTGLPIYISPPERAPGIGGREDSLKYRATRFLSERMPESLFVRFGNFCYRHMH
jgi:CelD/BcsL family acetyltransferase involved in cellulose biosynthesis